MERIELISSRDKFDPETKTELVFYHKNCADGSCSAGLHAAMKRARHAEQALSGCGVPTSTIYCPVKYGNETETVNIVKDRMSEYGIKEISELWILDFHFEFELLKDIFRQLGCPNKVVYFDHHKTAKEDLEKFRKWIVLNYYLTHIDAGFGGSAEAGAGMTYDYIVNRLNHGSEESAFAAGNNSGYKHIKELVDTCVDYDLWTHSNPDTMGIITGIMAVPLPVSKWADMLLNYSAVRDGFLNRGLGIIDQQKYIAQLLAESGQFPELEYGGCRIAMLNIPHQWVNIVSHELLERSDFDAVLSYSVAGRDEYVNVSMRTGKDRRLDCGGFMQEWFSGGGHPAAAGGRCAGIAEYFRQIENIKDLARNENKICPEVSR